MTSGQLRRKAQRLREQDLKYREISRSLGVSLSTAYRWANPSFEEQQRFASRAWKKANKSRVRAYGVQYRADPTTRATCSLCGGPMSYSTGQQCKAAEPVCANCESESIAQRDRELEVLWARGAKYPEVMVHFGWSKGVLQQEMFRARNRGAHLPYRRIDGRTHPELRKAA